MPVDAIVADIHAIEPNVEASWHVEIDRRLEQLRSGETTPIPLAEFKDELMERLCLR